METLQKKLDYTFKDIGLLELALTHKSRGMPNNERLEYLGDLILGFSVGYMLFMMEGKLSAGHMTQIASNIVSHRALLKVADMLQLSGYLQIEESADPHFSRETALSDAVEAIIAAIFLDSKSINKSTAFIIANVGRFDLRRDNKTVLQELVQAYGCHHPRYSARKISDRHFMARVSSPEMDISADGYGKTRKEAEMDAAGHLLRIMKK